MTDVLFIMGSGRSGSSALERFLAAHDGTVTVGEARAVWGRPFDERLCTCRVPVNACPFWSEVRRAIFGSLDEPDTSGAAALMSIRRYRYVP